jgi:plastocyanin
MRAAVVILLLAGAAAAQPVGRVVGTVAVTEADGKPAKGAEVVVYVVGFKEPGTGATATIVQRDRTFVPELVAITAGDSVAFPNADKFLHNVFSPSSTRRFDLGSFKRGESKTKEFPTTGVVDVYCNIHPEMAATILVVPNRAHARAKADGSFVVGGVPPGTWTVFAYTRRASKPVSAKVTVAAGADATVSLALQRGAEPEHLNKYGEKYHRGSPTTYR